MVQNSEDISLKEIILKTQSVCKYLLSKWMVIFFVTAIGGAAGLLYALTTKPVYSGELTFVLSSNSTSGTGLANLAGQFGIDINSGGNGAFEGDNIIQLLKSKRIIKGALFKYPVGEDNNLINIIAIETKFINGWKKDKRLAENLPFPSDINKLKPVQDSLVNVVYDFVVKNNLTVEKQDKKLSFYKITSTTTNEIISIYLTNYLVQEAAKMYIDTKTKLARESLHMLEYEADSLRRRLSGTIYSSADQIDRTFNLNSALQTQRVPIQQNQIQTQVLGAAYGEVVKNLELAKITLQKETPLFQIIDEPRSPLKRVEFSKKKGIVFGGMIAAFLAITLLLVSKVFKKILNG